MVRVLLLLPRYPDFKHPSALIARMLTRDSPVVTPGHAAMLNGHIAHEEHSQGLVPETHHGSHGSSSLDEKAQDHHVENV